MNKTKVILGIVAGFFATYVVATPYLTVYQMKSAAENHDGETLSTHIEFPSVRQSLKDQMNALYAKEMADKQEDADNPFNAMAAAFVGGMIDKIVDAYVTPAGITLLMAGDKPKKGTQSGNTGNDANHTPFSDASMSYKSFDQFAVNVKGDNGKEVQFLLSRRGLGWKLTDIIIPMD